MSALTLLNMQKFLQYKMENSAACCAWCSPEGSCVVEHFQQGRERRQSEQRRTHRTAVMVTV